MTEKENVPFLKMKKNFWNGQEVILIKSRSYIIMLAPGDDSANNTARIKKVTIIRAKF